MAIVIAVVSVDPGWYTRNVRTSTPQKYKDARRGWKADTCTDDDFFDICSRSPCMCTHVSSQTSNLSDEPYHYLGRPFPQLAYGRVREEERPWVPVQQG